MNALDLRRVVWFAYVALGLVPILVLHLLGTGALYVSKALLTAENGITKGSAKLHEWANPEVYGKAPKRARSLLYRRKTVERLCECIEELNRLIDRKYGGGDAP